MTIATITNAIQALETRTQRNVFFIYGAPKALSSNATKAPLNRIGPYQYQALVGAIDNPTNLPKIKQNEVDLVLSSPGGSIAFAIAIMRKLYAKYGRVNVIVPQMAGSCAALMSFSGSSLYLGPTAVTSDFWHNTSVPQNVVQPLISNASSIIQQGSVVDKAHIDRFILTNSILQRNNGHTSLQFQQLIAVCSSLNILLTTRDINRLDAHDPQHILNGVAADYLTLDDLIRTYMKNNQLSSFMLCSTISNLATN